MNLPLRSIQHVCPNPVGTMEKDEDQEDFLPISQQPGNDDSLVERGLSSCLDLRLVLGLLATNINNLAIGSSNE